MVLNNYQRQKLCAIQSTNKLNQISLANWAKEEFKLAKIPAQSTISNILKKRRVYDAMCEVDQLSAKRSRKLKNPELEKVLAAWVVECEELNICISYDIIKQKALALVDRLKVEDPPKFSNGWLQKFIKRHGFFKYKLHGESGSVNMVILNSAITALQVKIAKYDPSYVYNMDETGLFYTQVPSSTVSKMPIEGVKLDKKRITLALAADGLHKLPLLFIGKAKNRLKNNSNARDWWLVSIRLFSII